MAKILIIDDEHGPIEYYADALRERGYQVEHLDNVREVEALLVGPSDIDLFVVDIMMPTHGLPRYKNTNHGLATGLEVARAIRAQNPKVPIIMLTAIGTPEILDEIPVDDIMQVESKIETLPFELADIVDRALASGSKETSSR